MTADYERGYRDGLTGRPRSPGAETVRPDGYELQEAWKEIDRLRGLLRVVERHCPCGARPESLNTHPHVIGCPVGLALYSPHNDGQDDGG